MTETIQSGNRSRYWDGDDMILKLNEIKAYGIEVLGGKAFHLSELSNWGFNVPPGYIVPQEWFEGKDNLELMSLIESGKLYAVRSSAIDEDGSDYSFAGLQETFLNVDKDHVYDKVLECYNSQWSQRAMAYRDQHGLDDSTGMSVVIQEMVDAEYAGVIFTQHPMSNRLDEIVIEVVEGLGESLVSGLKTPTDYTVDKSTYEIKSMVINECELPQGMVEKLAQIAKAIEERYEGAQDIEFAVKGQEVYVLQSRPITTTTMVPKQKLGGLRFYLSFGHVQNMMYPITPVGAEMIMSLFNVSNQERLSDRVVYNGEFLFVDISDILLLPNFIFKRAIKGMSAINPHLPALAESYRGLNPTRKMMPLKLLFMMHKVLGGVLRYVLGKKYVPLELDRKLDACILKFESMGSIEELLENQNQILLPLAKIAVAYIATGLISFHYLGKLFDKWGLDRRDYNKLLAGASGNVTTEMGMLYDDMLRAYGTDNQEIMFQKYLEKYGMRTDGEIDFGRSRPEEDVELFRDKVELESQTISGISVREQHRLKGLEAEKIKGALEKKLSKRKWKKMSKWIDLMQSFMVLREHPKYAAVRIFRFYRRHVENPFVTLREQYRYKNYEQTTIEEREMRYKNAFDKVPPLAMLSNGMILKKIALQSGDNIYGLGVSAGLVTGRVRVIKTIEDDYLREGEILVTQFTDPGWTTVMAKASGFIIEVGGMMTHGAVVAREFGIPAVVSVEGATSKFKTGDLVVLNGDTGEIEVIEEKENSVME